MTYQVVLRNASKNESKKKRKVKNVKIFVEIIEITICV